ncbi:PAS domain S-box protein [Candidatus Parcubacteria bacterium]|nr:PAS domain S-box protein [Candidatus Parcubacteria bacterium]
MNKKNILTKQHQKILQMATKNKIFKLAVQSAFNHIIITDAEGVIIFANSAVTRITGYSPEEIIGNTPRLWGQQMPSPFYKKLWSTIKKDKKTFSGEITNKRKNGETYYAKAIISPIISPRKKIIGFIGTEEDVTKQKEVDKMKSEFISITAHQLKTPMTSLRWNLELLAESKLDKKQKEIIEGLSTTNEKLIDLVNTLLNISRIESGRITLTPEKINLTTMIDSVKDDYTIKIKEKSLTIKTDLEKNLPLIIHDTQFLRQILLNIMSNAIKYTPEKGTISISAKKEKEQIHLKITDTGIGIPKQQQKNIFQKFFRASTATDNAIEGNGLGLYFVSLIVKESKGKIWFESTKGK